MELNLFLNFIENAQFWNKAFTLIRDKPPKNIFSTTALSCQILIFSWDAQYNMKKKRGGEYTTALFRFKKYLLWLQHFTG